MKCHRILPGLCGLFILLVVMSASLVRGGELAADLQSQISGKSSDELVKVWIKLPRTENSRQFQKLLAEKPTREERYQTAYEHFRTNHAKAQANLVSYLNELAGKKRAGLIKAYWIVNMVEANVAVGELSALAARDDVEGVYSLPNITTIEPDPPTTMDKSSNAGVQINLTMVNAPAAWQAGYTGRGRLVCSFDTGVDGDHPALYQNWKGLDGDSAAAWFDPMWQQTFPHYILNCGSEICNPNHGTHTMGIMVGRDRYTFDTIGVAPAAKWISAAVIDIGGARIIDAFEWAADPDGDPNSLDDVPDVINHSWGAVGIQCQNIFYDAIDNTEALGIVNVFSAGNRGPSASTITNPADRANDSLDCFAVGSYDRFDSVIAQNSSRGPSPCSPWMIKPNVVAPGVGIWSSIPDDTYFWGTGTSMAAPHVSGLVALLRQKNPNATVDEVKEAILAGTNTLHLDLPDNNYGWGMIDCLASLDVLSAVNPDPNVRVFAFDHDPINPGDTVEGELVLKNFGVSLTGITAVLDDNNPALTVLAGLATFGTINEGDTLRAAETIRVVVDDTVTVGSLLSLDLQIIGDGYSETTKLYFSVQPPSRKSFLTHDVNNITFSFTNYGAYGLADGSQFPAGGEGFRYFDGANDIFGSGLMIGYAPNVSDVRVSDGVNNPAVEPDGDFAVSPNGNLAFVEPRLGVTQQSYSRFDDHMAHVPIGVEVEQHTFALDYAPYRDFVIMQYVIKNTTSTTLSNVYVGLFIDWDIENELADAGGYQSTEQLLWTAYNDETLYDYRGMRILDGTIVTAHTEKTANFTYYGPGLLESEKMYLLRAGFGSADSLKTASTDLSQVMAARTSLEAGQVDTIAFALLAGEVFQDIAAAAGQAEIIYDSVIMMDVPTINLPPAFMTVQDFIAYVGDTVELTVIAIDPNRTVPSLAAENLPDSAQFTDNGDGSGTLVWPITLDQVGDYDLRFIAADDSSLVDTMNVAVKVAELPTSFALYQNYPNPFNAVTTISFDLPEVARYTLSIYNIMGQKLVGFSAWGKAGINFYEWNAANDASGLYFYKVETGSSSQSKKMLLVK